MNARLFVAVRLPADLIDALSRLPRPETPGVRWTRPDQWHITLRFLGTCSLDDAVTALRALRCAPATARLGPRVERLGHDVVVVPVAGLDELAAAVIAATSTVGRPPERRTFKGHLTVARIRDDVACPMVGAAVAGEFRVGEVQLVRSHLHPRGARYETVVSAVLGGALREKVGEEPE